jgi:D-glycero-D-manno-heptose 1,7-bisphosphate phosphatase
MEAKLLITKNARSDVITTQRKALFLDRDGVVNEVVRDGEIRGARNLSELKIRPEISQISKMAKDNGFVTIVLTNQPDLAKGLITTSDLNSVNEALFDLVPNLDYIATCPHSNDYKCACRKPNAGMITFFANELPLDLESSMLIGDRWVDIQAGATAGLKTILIEGEYSWNSTSSGKPSETLRPDYTVTSMTELGSLASDLLSKK